MTNKFELPELIQVLVEALSIYESDNSNSDTPKLDKKFDTQIEFTKRLLHALRTGGEINFQDAKLDLLEN